MSKEDKVARELARLEEAQRISQERMAEALGRVNKRFDRMRERVLKKYGEPSDTQQRITEAALGLLKKDGLDNLSLRKLAAELNMQAPALYWHFQNKESLVDHMAEAILQKEFKDLQPRTDAESWQDWLIDHMKRLRKAMLAYPDGARVVAGAHIYPAVTLARSFDAALASLDSDGVELQTARHIIMTVTHYTFGHVIEEQAAPTPEQMAAIDLEELMAPYPHMQRVMGEIDFSKPDDDFVVGLQYIIRGAMQ